MNEEIPKKENTSENLTFSLKEQFDHDLRNKLTAVLMAHAVFQAYSENPSAGDVDKSKEDIKKMWNSLFEAAQEFLSGKFGKVDESLHSDIENLLTYKDRDPLDKASVDAMSDFLGKIFRVSPEETKKERGNE